MRAADEKLAIIEFGPHVIRKRTLAPMMKYITLVIATNHDSLMLHFHITGL